MLVILLLLFSWNSGCSWFSHMLQKQNWSKLSLLRACCQVFPSLREQRRRNNKWVSKHSQLHFDLAHHQNQKLTPQGQRVESGGGHQNGLLPLQSVLLQFLKPQKLTHIICHTFSPTFAMFHSGFLTYVATLFFFFFLGAWAMSNNSNTQNY